MEIDIEKWCTDSIKCRTFENAEDYDILDNIFNNLYHYKSEINPTQQLKVFMHTFDNENFSDSGVHLIQDGFCLVFSENEQISDELFQYFIDNVNLMYPHAYKWYGFFIAVFISQFEFTNSIVKGLSKTNKLNYSKFKIILEYIYQKELPTIEELAWYDIEVVKQNLNKISLTINT